MSHLRLRIPSLFKCVSSNYPRGVLRPSCTTAYICSNNYSLNLPNPKFYCAKSSVSLSNEASGGAGSTLKTNNVGKFSRATRKRAQAALLEYLHSIRNLQFLDADCISKKSPKFLRKLLKVAESEIDKGTSLADYLSCHPINEFEPFFESIGLEPSEFLLHVPRDSMFLRDDHYLLENYQVLHRYGVPRTLIGKIYREAREVFQYGEGVLQGKLRAYQQLELRQSAVAKLVGSCPYLLLGEVNREFADVLRGMLGEVNREFVEVLRVMKHLGFGQSWTESHLVEKKFNNWRQVNELLCMFKDLGYSKSRIKGLICQHPEIIFQDSGNRAFSLIGFLLKLGFSREDISLVLPQTPQMHFASFVWNMKRGYQFLTDIHMTVEDIVRIVRSHPVLLGSCNLKKLESILASLQSGKERVRGLVKENPEVLKKWIYGEKIERLLQFDDVTESQMEKKKFLLKLGFVEKSKEMDRAMKLFRGKGQELQERFDCLVETGLDAEEVSKMVKLSPQILNQSIDLLQTKLDCLINELGFPPSSLVAFPGCLSYKTQRIKLRYEMRMWLEEHGQGKSLEALSSFLAVSDRYFCSRYVNQHPRGPEVWQILKKKYNLE